MPGNEVTLPQNPQRSYKARVMQEYRAKQGATINDIKEEIRVNSETLEEMKEMLLKYTRKIDRLLERSER